MTKKRKKIRPMNAQQFRTCCDKLGITQTTAAKLLGVSMRTVNGYANGTAIPEPVARLIHLCTLYGVRNPEVFEP